jgi:hypothetical protein
MSCRLDHLRDTGVHVLVGLGVLGVVVLMATDWEAPGPSQAKVEDPEHFRNCTVCQASLQDASTHLPRAMDDMVALQEGSQASHWENARLPGGQEGYHVFRDAIETDPAP